MHYKQSLHLGTVLDDVGTDDVAVEDRSRKFYTAVNAAVARLAGLCLSNLAWKQIMDVQLSPVLFYGSHLWELDKSSVVRAVNRVYRKGIRRGLGMRDRDSVTGRLGDWFVEAAEKMKKDQVLFLKRSIHSVNDFVKYFGWLHLRNKPISGMNVFACTYEDLKVSC